MRDVIKQQVLPQSRRAVRHRCIKAKALHLWCNCAQAPLDKAGFPLFSRVTALHAAVAALRLSFNGALKKHHINTLKPGCPVMSRPRAHEAPFTVLTFLAKRGSLQFLGMMGSEGGRLAAFLAAPSASSVGGAFSGSLAQRRISATRHCSTVATCAVSWCSKPACS